MDFILMTAIGIGMLGDMKSSLRDPNLVRKAHANFF